MTRVSPHANPRPENILPTRRAIWFSTVLGVLALFDLGWAAEQLAYAYFSGEGLDADVPTYLFAAALFLFATYAASYQLRKICRQLGHLHGLRRRVVMAQYDAPCSPGVAGALVDGEFDLAEIKGTMIYLAQRGYLERTPDPAGGEVWSVGREDVSDLRPSEVTLIVTLFANSYNLRLPAMADRLGAASKAIHDEILADGRAAGFIHPAPVVPELVRFFHQLALGTGYFVITIMFMELIFDWHNTTTILYPRYPVHLWQLLFIIALILIVLVVAGGAYVRAFVTARGMDLSADIAGFYLFIKKVFENPNRYLAKSDIEKYYPYAVAFRLPAKLPDEAAEQWQILLSLK
jgi:hypothetical protein